jgi:hypothetical protein
VRLRYIAARTGVTDRTEAAAARLWRVSADLTGQAAAA